MSKHIFLAVFLLFLILSNGCGVQPATVSSITISPSSATLQVGSSESFSSVATFSDGTTGTVTSSWSVSPSSLGTITSSGSAGIFTAAASGTGTIIATYNGVSANATIIVSGGKTLSSLVVSPSSISLQIGSVEAFSSTAYYSDSSSSLVTSTWSVTPTSLGTVISSGPNCLFTPAAAGSGFVTATYGGISANSVITVTAGKTVTSLNITPTNVTLILGSSTTFHSTAQYSDSTLGDITATWQVIPSNLGTLSPSGAYCLFGTTSVTGEGLVQITYNGMVTSTPITVSP